MAQNQVASPIIAVVLYMYICTTTRHCTNFITDVTRKLWTPNQSQPEINTQTKTTADHLPGYSQPPHAPHHTTTHLPSKYHIRNLAQNTLPRCAPSPTRTHNRPHSTRHQSQRPRQPTRHTPRCSPRRRFLECRSSRSEFEWGTQSGRG